LPIHAVPGVDDLGETSIIPREPRAIARAPPRADPRAQPPAPPPGLLRIEKLWVCHHARNVWWVVDKPKMLGMQINLVHRPVAITSDGFVVVLHGSPKVCDVPVDIVDSFDVWGRGPSKQYGKAAGKRFDVIFDVAESFPHQRSRAALATEVLERRFEFHSNSPLCPRAASE